MPVSDRQPSSRVIRRGFFDDHGVKHDHVLTNVVERNTMITATRKQRPSSARASASAQKSWQHSRCSARRHSVGQAAAGDALCRLVDYWYETHCKPNIRTSTQSGYEDRIRLHIKPELGEIPLNRLTQNDLQQFYARLKKSGRKTRTECYGEGLSDRMVRMCHATCRSALQRAVQDGLIRTNPAEGCKLPPKKAREMQVLARDELQRFLIQAQAEGYYELFLLDLATGLRRGELLALQWDDLDFETGVLTISKQVSLVRGKIVMSVPKTKSSIRKLVLPPAVVQVLKEYRESVHSRWMFPSPVLEDLPLNPGSVYDRLQLILEHASCKQVRFHDLRHTFATLALQNGMDVKTLSCHAGACVRGHDAGHLHALDL